MGFFGFKKRNAPVATLTWIAILCVTTIGLVGCGSQDPIAAIRNSGADIRRNNINKVEGISFPLETTDDDLKPLIKLKRFLTEVDLSTTQVTDEGLEHLLELDNLTKLHLNNTAITDAGLKTLSESPSLQISLRIISLGDTNITDKGLETLAELENLEEINLERQPDPVKPNPRTAKNALRFGIDLAGGTNMVFKVDTDEARRLGKNVKESMDRMVGAIIKRINPGGTQEVTVRRVGNDRIEVIIPGADRQEVTRYKRLMTRLGSLEFEILANTYDHGPRGIRNKGLIKKARAVPDSQREVKLTTQGPVMARWRDITPGEEFSLDEVNRKRIAIRQVKIEDRNVTQVLVMVTHSSKRVTGKYLIRATQETDSNGGLAVGFSFNGRGANLFGTMTSNNRPTDQEKFKRSLAIILDGDVYSAPNIRETISSSGIISGSFTQDQVTELINVLNAGALEVPIEKSPLSEFSISPLLGADVQKKGIWAITIAAIVVVLFMLAYYRFAGVVANLCLMLNLLLVMGTMALIQATFTLPGLAGLVLTIGMAVDANVLIFERIREELNRGSSLRMAINNGFSRALTTIVDANLTTLIVAVVLYMIGTDQVKGFAVTLFIGIVTSMFCSLYFGRLIFDVCERKKWLKKLSMGSIIGSTSIDFVGKKSVALICSVVLIVCGMISLFARGRDNLDIDFRGGVMVTYVFEEPHKLDDVRAKLDENNKFAGNYTLEKLDIEDPDDDTQNTDLDTGIRYRLRTIETDQEIVAENIVTTFDAEGWNLVIIKMEIGDIRAIAVPTAKIESNGDEKSEDKPAVTVAQDEKGFEGGHRVSLTFSDEITIDMVSGNMLEAITELNENKDREDKYDDAELLFELKGVEGPKAKDNEVKRFTSMDLFVRQNLDKSDLDTALSAMKTTMGNSPTFEEVNKFSKTVGVEMQQSAILAILISLVAIVAYIWFRFQKITFGLAAVVALVHDVLVVLGMVALFSYLNGTTIGNVLAIYDFKINLPMIAAFLTIIGYSLNDTIVVFDRIREVRGKNPALSSEMVNKSLNQTLSRTLLTSLTTFVVVVILYFLGGEGIHGFAFCLVIGVLVGTYSSIYVASPVLLWLMNRGEKPAVAT